MDISVRSRIFPLLAELLSYPDPNLVSRVRQCLEALPAQSSAASEFLTKFIAAVEKEPLGRMQEIFTRTFDLGPVCYPYIGYQLFGEDYKRGNFMVTLLEGFKANGFAPPEGELPDHLAVCLNFLAVLNKEDLVEAFYEECLIPSLEKMTASFEGEANPYNFLIKAIQAVVV